MGQAVSRLSHTKRLTPLGAVATEVVLHALIPAVIEWDSGSWVRGVESIEHASRVAVVLEWFRFWT